MNQTGEIATAEAIQKLIDKALIGEHTECQLLRSTAERQAALIIYTSVNHVVKYFKRIEKSLLKLNTQEQGFDLIKELYQIRKSIEYYTEERNIYADLVDEYSHYVLDHHAIPQVLLRTERPEEDLVDWRQV